MKRFIDLGGVEFELKQYKGNDIHDDIARIIRTSKTLDDCYKKPSYAKQYIYNMWLEWSRSIEDLYSFGIRSYNTNIFTLQGYVNIECDTYGLIDVTPTHRYIYVKEPHLYA